MHGPLRRHVVGGGVQGLDYTYTLEGWLKAINHSSLLLSNDPGGDSSATCGKDVFGMVLNYYKGDFNRTGSVFNSIGNPLNLYTTDAVAFGGGDLFNGNITSWTSNLQDISTVASTANYQHQVGATYRYDQLNRITKNRFWDWYLDPLLGWQWHRVIPPGANNPYDEDFTYDKNGNLQTLNRTAEVAGGGANVQIDQLKYILNHDALANNINQLNSINDLATPPTGMNDVENGTTNYLYDEIGELNSETAPSYHLDINWTPYGKVDVIKKSGSTNVIHYYLYDAMGNQVRDIRQSGSTTDTTYHIYDGHNTQLAVYHGDPAPAVPGADIMSIKERYLYGSDKLGTLRGSNIVGHYTTIGTYGGGGTFTVFLYAWGATPDREYELHDHLGNVRATISSRMPNSTGIVHLSNYYNYYAFGSYEPNRCFEPGGLYAFGFNGQEKKDDYKVPGGHNHALYWEYDTRIGRRWNLDPKPNESLSNYSAFSDNPILKNDLNGDIVKTTQEGFNILKGALSSTVGAFSDLFGFDALKGEMTFDEGAFAKLNLNSLAQSVRDVVSNLKTVVESKEAVVTLIPIDFKEKFTDIMGGVASLADRFRNGICMPSGLLSNHDWTVFVARNPQARTKIPNPRYHEGDKGFFREPPEIDGWLELLKFWAGVSALHEVGGHAYFHITQPALSTTDHNHLVEQFETNFRQFYIISRYQKEREVRRANKEGKNVNIGDAKEYLGGQSTPHDSYQK